MVDFKSLNDNIISNQWKKRYAQQPDEIKKKLDKLDNANATDYQLQVIKRKRIYPEIGDIFQVNPHNDIILYGVVINNHVNNINGEDLLVVMIFKNEVDIKESISHGVKYDELFIPPQIVGKEYWTRGYFYNIDHYNEKINVGNYGFYSIGKKKFLNEYGDNILDKIELLGTYGVATIYGIAMEINQELIIAGIV